MSGALEQLTDHFQAQAPVIVLAILLVVAIAGGAVLYLRRLTLSGVEFSGSILIVAIVAGVIVGLVLLQQRVKTRKLAYWKKWHEQTSRMGTGHLAGTLDRSDQWGRFDAFYNSYYGGGRST